MIMIAPTDTIREDVRISETFLDETYGRVPKPRDVEKLVREWDREKVGVIYLSLRDDGRFAVIDGNHRISALRVIHGEDAVIRALVFIDKTVQEEAYLYNGFNRDRKRQTPGQLFKSRLAELEPAAVDIHQIVTSLGLDIAFDGVTADKKIKAVGALDSIYRRHGGSILRDVVLTLRNTMGDGEGALQAHVMLGLAAFLERYRYLLDFDPARLYAILSTHSPAQIKQLSHTIRAGSDLTVDSYGATGMAILQIYNKGLRSKQLPAWQGGVVGEASKERSRPARVAAMQAGRQRANQAAHENGAF